MLLLYSLPLKFFYLFSFENVLFIGVAFIGDKIFYEKILNKINNHPNIRYKYYDMENNIGVGIGRYYAAQLYNNEDYFFITKIYSISLVAHKK